MSQIILHPTKQWLAHFMHKQESHLIFYRPSGIYRTILVSVFEQLESMMSHYSKVTVVLLQLHQSKPRQDNKQLTNFLSKLKHKLQAHYGGEIGYCWVREKNEAGSHHYHLAILLNGHKCQSSSMVDHLAKQLWANRDPDNFSFKLRNRIYRLRPSDPAELRACKLRLSYMAKQDSKEAQVQRFGTSRLKPKTNHTKKQRKAA